MSVFISYSRKDRQAVEALRDDIEKSKLDVWFDDELTGGQAWWDTILEQIRQCELFVFALSADSLHSKACSAELDYALSLNRPCLPVMVAEVAVQLAPPAIVNAHIVDYRQRTADNAIGLMGALASRPKPPPLPPVLPAEPPIPMSYMNTFREKLDSQSLTYLEQTQLVTELRGYLHDEYTHDVAIQLLRQLRGRPDISESVGRDVDAVLAEDGSPWRGPEISPEPQVMAKPSAASTPAGWFPDPQNAAQQRYWDGSAWTDHVSGASASGTQTSQGTTPAAANGPKPWSGGIFVALLVATFFIGLVGIVMGAINLKKPERKRQSQILIGLGVAMIVLNLLLIASSSSSTTGAAITAAALLSPGAISPG